MKRERPPQCAFSRGLTLGPCWVHIRSSGRDCARPPSHTTGRAVFRIRRLNPAALSCWRPSSRRPLIRRSFLARRHHQLFEWVLPPLVISPFGARVGGRHWRLQFIPQVVFVETGLRIVRSDVRGVVQAPIVIPVVSLRPGSVTYHRWWGCERWGAG